MRGKQIILKRLGARGDVIMTTPILRALRRENPDAKISVVTDHPEVFFGNTDCTDLLHPNSWIFHIHRDITIELDNVHEGMPGQHIVEAYAGAVGISVPRSEWKPSLYFDRASKELAEAEIKPGLRHAFIHYGPINGWAGRQWAKDRFVQVAAELEAAGFVSVGLGSLLDAPLPCQISLHGVTFRYLCAAMSLASIFVGVDSMPFHVAQAFSIPSAVIFGSVLPELRIVPGGPVRAITATGLDCLGCHHRQIGPKKILSCCPEGHDRCMKDLTVERVMGIALSL